MITYKNIIISLYLITFAREAVNTGVSRKDLKCMDRLYDEFGWDKYKPLKDRLSMPQLAFLNKIYDKLANEVEPEPNISQRYFLHIYELLQARNGTLPLRPWCNQFMIEQGFNGNVFEFESDCFMKLHIFFLDSENPIEILKDAYSNLVISRFTDPNEHEAKEYFIYLSKRIECIVEDGFMTPREICQGRTEATPNLNKKRSKPNPRGGAKFKLSSSKIKKT